MRIILPLVVAGRGGGAGVLVVEGHGFLWWRGRMALVVVRQEFLWWGPEVLWWRGREFLRMEEDWSLTGARQGKSEGRGMEKWRKS